MFMYSIQGRISNLEITKHTNVLMLASYELLNVSSVPIYIKYLFNLLFENTWKIFLLVAEILIKHKDNKIINYTQCKLHSECVLNYNKLT